MFGCRRKRRFAHPTASTFYNYHDGLNINAGAQEFVFEPKFSLPLIGADRAGMPVLQSLNPLQPVPLYLATPRVAITGIGTQVGDIRFQPLLGEG